MSTYVMATQKNYSYFDSLLQGRNQQSRKLNGNTYLQRRGDNIAILLHNTDVVTYTPQGLCILTSGGWNTPTTRERIETYAPVRMWSQKRTPFVSFNGKTYQFFDGITFDLNTGEIEGEAPDLASVNAYNEALTKRVEKLLKSVTITKAREALADVTGDCWACSFLHSDDPYHLWIHVNEQTCNGSMIRNAYMARGYGDYRVVLSMHMNRGEDAYALKELRGNLKKYLMGALWNKNYALNPPELEGSDR